MHKNGGVVNFNDDQLKIIKENVDTIYHKILNTRFKQVLISNDYKIIAYLIFILGFLVITIGIVLIYSVLRVNLSKDLDGCQNYEIINYYIDNLFPKWII